MKKADWIERGWLDTFEAEGTDAHRLCTIDGGWAERFDREILISFRTTAARDRLVHELNEWNKSVEFPTGRVFGRVLPKENEERETPKLIIGNEGENLETTATEHHLKFGIDFGAGYSVGLFVDQRENRRYIRQVEPKRLLNSFAYTCSFSVAAASVGAQTVNVDLSKKSLARGRQNFALNSLPISGHELIADDVRPVLRRLARRGQKFDMIILDPPTFSRSHRGKVFHVQKDFENLLLNALELADRDCRILLSTNCSGMRAKSLEVMARYCMKLTRRAAKFHRAPGLPDFPEGAAASTIWMVLR